MSVEDLTQLTIGQLRKVSNANWIAFNTLAIINLFLFYHSLFSENWILLFLSFGLFLASLAVYDNYRVSKKCLDDSELS